MTDKQNSLFDLLFERVSNRVSRRVWQAGHIKSPAHVKTFFGFSHGQLAALTGYSRAHVQQCVLYGRPMTPACLAAWQDLLRAALRKVADDTWAYQFADHSLTPRLVRICPVCQRVHPATFGRCTPAACRYHRTR